MARATKATTTRRSAKPAEPRKKIGRPLGSKNKVVAPAKSKSQRASKKPLVRRAAAVPAAVRMNKADLEAHVVKLERGLARARTQTAELKKALKEAQQASAKTAEPSSAPTKATRKRSSGNPVKRGRHPEAADASPEQAEGSEVDPIGD